MSSSTPQALESYLARLDRALSAVAVSERAEIVTEIKSHVLSALERDNGTNVEDVLDSLGEPETVASRYLLERGLKPAKPPRTGILKWIVTLFLGTGFLIVLGIGILVWKFTPLIKIDDKNERVTILGGLIDIDGKSGSFKAGDLSMGFDENSKRLTGSKPLDPKKYDDILVPFSNGRVAVRSSGDGSFRWDCRLGENGDNANVQFHDRSIEIDLSRANAADCELWVPQGINLKLNGVNGRVKLLRPAAFVAVQLSNGVVQIEPDPALKYKYELKTTNGKMDNFESSSEPGAIPLNVTIVNGRIEREAGETYDLGN